MISELEGLNRKYIIISVVLSVMTTLGIVCSSVSVSQTIPGFVRQHINVVLLLFVICLFFYRFFVEQLFNKMDDTNAKLEKNYNTKGIIIVDYKKWMKFFFIILICWIPYLIICYPAVTRGYDYFWQLLQGLGIFPLSNHHPVLSSYVFGALFSIGNKIGGAEGGFFFTMIVQLLLMTGVISFALSCLLSMGANKRIVMIVCIFISLCPVFPTHAIWLCKDSILSSICILLFLQLFVNVWCSRNGSKVPVFATAPMLILVSLLFCLYRHGVIVIAVMIIGIVFYVNIKRTQNRKKEVIKWGLASLAFVLVVLGSNMIMDHAKITQTNTRESLSMPLRQIMRSIQLNPNDKKVQNSGTLSYLYREEISKGEKIIDVANKYNVFNADFIKPDYIYDNTIIKSLAKLWLETGVKHPGCYIDAAVRGTYGYWWLEIEPEMMKISTELGKAEDDFANDGMKNVQLKNMFLPTVKSLEKKGISTEITFDDLQKKHPVLKDIMNVKTRFNSAREMLEKYIETLKKIPVVSLIFVPGLYFWIMIIAFGYLFSRKKDGKYLWPILLLEIIAWLSPVNGYTRYILSAEVISLLLICLCFAQNSQDNKSDKGEVGL